MLKKTILGREWPLFIILLIAACLLLFKIDKPFWGHHDWNGVYWGNVTRNYLRYGYLETKLAMVENVGVTSPKNFAYTFHYSPLFPITQSLFLRLTGVHEWSFRLLAIFFSLGTLAIFYFLISKFFSRTVAVSAILFWIATPMFIYFGKMPVHEPMELFFSILVIYFYLNRSPKLVLLFLTVAELTTWPGYFLVLAMTVHWLVFDHGKNIKPVDILWFWLLSLGVFLFLILHDFLVTGSLVGGGLAEIFFLRVKGVAVIPYIAGLSRWLWTYYTFMIPLGMLFGILAWRRKINRPDIPLLFFVFALVYPIVFQDASFRHDYLLIYFLPFLTLASALALNVLVKMERVLVVAVIIIGMASLLIRWRFILALENSDIYRESVRLGRYINAHTAPRDKVSVIISDKSVGFDGWFINYYADRVVDLKNSDVTVEYSPGGVIQYQRVG